MGSTFAAPRNTDQAPLSMITGRPREAARNRAAPASPPAYEISPPRLLLNVMPAVRARDRPSPGGDRSSEVPLPRGVLLSEVVKARRLLPREVLQRLPVSVREADTDERLVAPGLAEVVEQPEQLLIDPAAELRRAVERDQRG